MIVGTSRKLYLSIQSTEYNFFLLIMMQTLRNRTEIQQELTVETVSDEAVKASFRHCGSG
jgi:hypothetical protein